MRLLELDGIVEDVLPLLFRGVIVELDPSPELDKGRFLDGVWSENYNKDGSLWKTGYFDVDICTFKQCSNEQVGGLLSAQAAGEDAMWVL